MKKGGKRYIKESKKNGKKRSNERERSDDGRT